MNSKSAQPLFRPEPTNPSKLMVDDGESTTKMRAIIDSQQKETLTS